MNSASKAIINNVIKKKQLIVPIAFCNKFEQMKYIQLLKYMTKSTYGYV